MAEEIVIIYTIQFDICPIHIQAIILCAPPHSSTYRRHLHMKQTILDRYERNTEGRIIIDVAASQVEELYNNYDRSAPYIRRDLEKNLVNYLIDCAKEIVPQPFVVMFTLKIPPDESRESRVRNSVNAYFMYLQEIEGNKIIEMFRRSAIMFSIGITILFLSVYVNHAVGEEHSIVAMVFAEGLTIAAWVSLWESLAIVLIEWLPYRKNILLYRELADAELIFRSGNAEAGRIDMPLTSDG